MRSPAPLLLCLAVVVGCLAADTGLSVDAAHAVATTISTAPGETLAFVPPVVTVEGGRRLVIRFRNGSSLEHNLTFTGSLDASTRTIVEAGGSDVLELEAPPAGTYAFVCTIHDGMFGLLTVTESTAR